MNDADLFTWTPPAARRNDAETSIAAAKVAAMRASAGRMLVLQYLRERPLTDYDLADLTGWPQNSIGKRRGECCAHGLATVAQDGDGETVKRPGPTGSLCRVWEITEQGRSYFAANRPALCR
jgi:hypothetical protein